MAAGGARGRVARAVDNAVRYPGAVYRVLLAVAACVFLLMAGFPLYWLVVLAVTPSRYVDGLGLVPETVTAGNLAAVVAGEFLRHVLNGLVVAGLTTVVVLVVATLAGYAFGRLEFPGRRPLLFLTLCVAYFPPVAFLVPLFRLLTGSSVLRLGPVTVATPDLFSTPAAVALPVSGLTMPLAVFVLTTFYAEIPDRLEDAARVEGATRVGALRRVVVPLSGPGVATAGVLTFLGAYNEFLFSLVMTDGTAAGWAPLVPALYDLTAAQAGFAAAGSVVALLPVAAVLALADERIARGLGEGFGQFGR